jgi:hypothetical protein
MTSRCKACDVLLDPIEAQRMVDAVHQRGSLGYAGSAPRLYVELCTSCYIASGQAKYSLEDMLSEYSVDYSYGTLETDYER